MLLVFRDTQEDDLQRGGGLPGEVLGSPSNTSEENGGFACLSPSTWMFLQGCGGPRLFCKLCVNTQEVRTLSS